MKEKICRVLRALRIDVLLYALYVKIVLAVTKKLVAVKNAVHRFLTRLFPSNGKNTQKVAPSTTENV